MKIYTKKGDKGQTSLLTGTKVQKFDERIEAYGTIDELNSFTGLLNDFVESKAVKDDLLKIQNQLFIIGSRLASDNKNIKNLPDIDEEDSVFLEKAIDRMEIDLPKLTAFILPGGHQAVSFCHVARSICRRAERQVVRLQQNEYVNPLIIKYLNRLSDYFFVCARLLANQLKIVEIKWSYKLKK